MYSRLFLKEKTNEKAVYRYGADKPNAPSDGEIEVIFSHKEEAILDCKILKIATHDENGWHGKWVCEHLHRVIFVMKCPENIFLRQG